MPAVLTNKGPTCCDAVMQPANPTTYCPFCYRTYNYRELREAWLEWRKTPSDLTPSTPSDRIIT